MKDLTKFREEIDLIDDELIRLLKKRMELSKEIAKHKMEYALPVVSEKRESEILGKVTEGMGEEFAPYGENIYNHIFESSKAYQERYMRK